MRFIPLGLIYNIADLHNCLNFKSYTRHVQYAYIGCPEKNAGFEKAAPIYVIFIGLAVFTSLDSRFTRFLNTYNISSKLNYLNIYPNIR